MLLSFGKLQEVNEKLSSISISAAPVAPPALLAHYDSAVEFSSAMAIMGSNAMPRHGAKGAGQGQGSSTGVIHIPETINRPD